MLLKRKEFEQFLDNFPIDDYNIKTSYQDSVKLISAASENSLYMLAAPQIGVLAPMFILGDPNHPETFHVCIKPKIIAIDDIKYEMETCANYNENFKLKKKIAHDIKFRAADIDSFTQIYHYRGVTARLVSQAIDFISGLQFRHGVNYFHLRKAIKKCKNH